MVSSKYSFKSCVSMLWESDFKIMRFSFDKVLDFFDFNITLYCLLYTVTIFINKYILSTLKFTYPTVFQGWQTLIASLFLFVIKLYSDETLKQPLHGYGIISMVPNILFHVGGIVAGSKALSAIPISVFLGTTNITNVAVLFSVNKRVSKFHFMSGIVTFATSAVVMLSRQVKIDLTGDDNNFSPTCQRQNQQQQHKQQDSTYMEAILRDSCLMDEPIIRARFPGEVFALNEYHLGLPNPPAHTSAYLHSIRMHKEVEITSDGQVLFHTFATKSISVKTHYIDATPRMRH